MNANKFSKPAMLMTELAVNMKIHIHDMNDCSLEFGAEKMLEKAT